MPHLIACKHEIYNITMALYCNRRCILLEFHTLLNGKNAKFAFNVSFTI